MLRDPLRERSVLYLNPLHLSFPDRADAPLSRYVPLPPPRLKLIPGPGVHGRALYLISLSGDTFYREVVASFRSSARGGYKESCRRGGALSSLTITSLITAFSKEIPRQ